MDARRRSRWMVFGLLPGLLLAGCARNVSTAWSDSGLPSVRQIKAGPDGVGLMKEVRIGKMPDGHLVNLTWTHDIQLVRFVCLSPQAIGCQRSEVVPARENEPGYRRQFIVVYIQERVSDATMHLMAHEICHAVANAQNLQPDPCHNEDGGQISLRP